MGNNRVAVTGVGIICGLGNDLNSVWNGIVEGKSGITAIENSNVADLPVRIAGEVKNFAIAEDLLDPREASKYDKFVHFALHSTKEALKNAGLLDDLHYDPANCGSILGVGMGGFPMIEDTHKTLMEKGAKRVSPFFVPAIIPNMATGMISIKFGVKGVNYTLASACASAAHAISAASFEIMSGRCDMMITGGAESVLCGLPISGFASMKAVSKNNENPSKASRPFDTGRDGFVMGEGAGILILENYEKAKARGAKIYAEIVGHGSTSDAHHITAPHPEGEGASRCMLQAIRSAGITPQDVNYINAHGTSTPIGDIAEITAIKRTFGEHAKKLYVSSTKSMIGHLLGAAGGVESVFCVMALHTGVIPPTINIENQDPQCDLNVVPNKAVKAEINYALNNSFGFGGTNSSLIFKKV